MSKASIGIVGGSGVYEMGGIEKVEEIELDTPFGKPSDKIVLGKLGEQAVAFLPRHGVGHRVIPAEINVRANIYALKSLGVEWIVAMSACGSMKEELKPLDFVVPDQFFDRTRTRPSTFFGDGIVAHISFADPVCPNLSKLICETAREVGCEVHLGGTYVCIEGPQLSTRAESRIYRQWGVDIIGMTAIPEAKLAREAEICYATMAMVTDYDVWHEGEEDVTIDMVLENMSKNIDTAKKVLSLLIPKIGGQRDCTCATALRDSIITQRDHIAPHLREKLDLLIGKYLRET